MQQSLSELANDAAAKQAALGMDRTAHKLRNTSRGLEFQDGIEHFDNTSVAALQECKRDRVNTKLDRIPVIIQRIWCHNFIKTHYHIYRVAQKNWHHFLYAFTSSNINQFSKLFYCKNQEEQSVNQLIFGKVKAYKNGANFLGHPVLLSMSLMLTYTFYLDHVWTTFIFSSIFNSQFYAVITGILYWFYLCINQRELLFMNFNEQFL